MALLSLKLPTMYGDHHVVEVRRLLFELAGVTDIYASSSFQIVEVDYDEAKLDADVIKARLEEAGYLGEMPTPVETGAAVQQDGDRLFFRHSAAFKQTGKTIGFTQQVPFTGRPLWPCPGMGVIEREEETTHG